MVMEKIWGKTLSQKYGIVNRISFTCCKIRSCELANDSFSDSRDPESPEIDSPVPGGTVARSGGGGVLVPGTLSQEERSEGGHFALDLVRR